MSYADRLFIAMCQDILENGTSTEGEKVRLRREDGTSAYTIKSGTFTRLTRRTIRRVLRSGIFRLQYRED